MKDAEVLLLSNDTALTQHWAGISELFEKVEQVQTLDEALSWLLHHGQGSVLVDSLAVDLTDIRWQELFSNPAAQVLVGSLSPSDPEGQKMIVAGAKAYFHAYTPVTVITTMIQQVQLGNIWLGQSLLSRLLSEVSTQLNNLPPANWHQKLTPREIEVAQRVALGHSNTLVAQDLGISERTVRAHLGSVFEKLGVSDRLMLALKVHGVG